jgi:hypothetical protein
LVNVDTPEQRTPVGLTPDVERTLRRYVLGALEEEPRTEVEERLVTDADAFEALGVVEDELIEEYIEQTGPVEDRRGFERSFLARPEGVRRLRLARELRRRAASRPATRTRAEAEPVGRAASWWRPSLIALAAALFASLAGNVWFATRTAPVLETTPTSRPRAAGTAAPADSDALRVEREARADLEARVRVLEAQRRAAHPTAVLGAGPTRGDEGRIARVAADPDSPVIELAVAVPGGDEGTYRATVQNEDGVTIWAASTLSAGGPAGRRTLALIVQASLLPRGDYVVRVESARGSEFEAVGTYPFRVTGAKSDRRER